MQDINLYQLLRYYAKKWIVIIALTLAGLAAGLIYSFYLQTPLYKSDATLILIDPAKTTSASKDPTLINNYLELFTSRRVLQPVIDKLSLDESYDQLVRSVSANSEKDTEVIKISVATDRADESMLIADAAIASFKQEVSNLYEVDNVQVVDKASRPSEPFNVRVAVQVGLATAVGLIAALVWLFFVYDLAQSKHTTKSDAAPKDRPLPDPDQLALVTPDVVRTNQSTSVVNPDITQPSDTIGDESDKLSSVVNTLIGTQIKPKRKKQKKNKSSNKRKK